MKRVHSTYHAGKLNTLENGAGGKFPRRIKIGERAAGYRLSEFRHGSVVSGILDGNLEKQNTITSK